MRRVLITGGTGFIGFHLARRHLEHGDAVVLFDNGAKMGAQPDAALRELLAHPRLEWKRLDLTRPLPPLEALQTIDMVYHLAAINGTKLFYEMPFQVARDNLLVTLNLLEWLRGRAVGRLVYASTSEVYAGCEEVGLLTVPTDERTPVVFTQPTKVRFSYGTSKFMGEFLCGQFGHDAGIPTTTVRYHNVYGPRMGTHHVIPEFILRLRQGQRPFRIRGAGETRAFCFVDDAVEATMRVAATPAAANEIVHIGNSREEVTIRELAQVVMQVLGVHWEIEEEPSLPGSVQRRCPDTAKLRRLTGYEAAVPLRDGVARTAAWYAAEPRMVPVDAGTMR